MNHSEAHIDWLARFLPGHSTGAVLDDPDVLRVGHGPLDRLVGLAALAATESVETILRRAPRAVVSAWNIDWNSRAEGTEPDAGLDLRVDISTGLRFLANGATLYVDHIEDAFPEFAGARQHLERALGLPRGRCKQEMLASIGGTGAAMHFDPDYAINIQIIGRKRWWATPNHNVENPLAGATIDDIPDRVRRHAHRPDFPTHMPDSAESFIAEPGTAVWVPRGWWHATEVLDDGESLSLCFGLKTPTVAQDFARRMERYLARIPAWREPWFGSSGNLEQQRAYIRTIEALFAELLDERPQSLSDRLFYDLPGDWSDVLLTPCPGASAHLSEGADPVAVIVETPSRTTEIQLAGQADAMTPVASWLCAQTEPFSAVEVAACNERVAGRADSPVPFIIDDVLLLIEACVQAGLLQRGCV